MKISREEYERNVRAFNGIGSWLSAALNDPLVCKEYKDEILIWFHDVVFVIETYENENPNEDHLIGIKKL